MKNWRIGNNELRYVTELLNSGFPGRQSRGFIGELEKNFAEKFGSKFAITFTNGTATLHAALVACGVSSGDEVIVPPLTMSSTSLAVLHAGAIPVFADVDPDTFVLTWETVKPHITDKTKAIMPVNLYGLPAVTEEFVREAAAYGLPVIEDSAQCFLGKAANKYAGTVGKIGSFSFQNSKHMTCGEGGITVTDDPVAAERLRRFSSLGYGLSAEPGKSKIDKNSIVTPDTIRHVEYGFNYRLSEVCGAIALAQLERLDEFTAQRIRCAEAFMEVIDGCKFLKIQKTPENIVNSYWALAVELDQTHVCWKEFQQEFLKQGGDGFYGAWRLAYKEPFFAALYPHVSCPIAEKLQRNMIQLKTHYLFEEEMPTQLNALKSVISKFS